MRSRSVSAPGEAELVLGDNGKVLLLSMRRLATLVASCILYEFEDVILELTGADCVEVGNNDALEFSRRAYKLLRLASHSPRFARTLAPSSRRSSPAAFRGSPTTTSRCWPACPWRPTGR